MSDITPNIEKKKSHPIKATLLFWLCVFFGPFMIFAISYLSYWLGGWENSIIMDLICYLLQGAACFIAYSLSFHYSKNGRTYKINGIICTVYMSLCALSGYYTGRIPAVITSCISVIVLVFCILLGRNMPDILE